MGSWVIQVKARITDKFRVLGAMPTLVVGMFSRGNCNMATQAWPWHPHGTRMAPAWHPHGTRMAPATLTGDATLAVGSSFRATNNPQPEVGSAANGERIYRARQHPSGQTSGLGPCGAECQA